MANTSKLGEKGSERARVVLGVLTAFQVEAEWVESRPGSLEERAADCLECLGAFEGQWLKGWGLISEEFMGVLNQYASALGFFIKNAEAVSPLEENITMDISPGENFNPIRAEKFLTGLFRVYTLRPVVAVFSSAGKMGAFTISPAATSTKATDLKASGDFLHKLNNYLGGITGFASVLERDLKNKESVALILESVQNIRKLAELR